MTNMNYIIKILLTAFAVFILGNILPGIVIDNYTTAIIVAVILGILNLIAKPIFVILTIPLTIISLGLFLFVINAIIVMIAGYFIDGFLVTNIFWALLFSIILSITESILYKLLD
jgi:putative membrane protein